MGIRYNRKEAWNVQSKKWKQILRQKQTADSNLSLLGGSGKQGFLITNHWKHPILSTLHLAGIPNLGGNFCYCSVKIFYLFDESRNL
jgi:hypothetical protein